MIAACQNKMLGFLASCLYIYSGDPNGSLDNRSNPIKVQHKIALRNTANMSILISYRWRDAAFKKVLNIKYNKLIMGIVTRII
jgi:hypothetical protein